MKASEIAISVEHLTKKQRPLFIWGPPGIGKSDVVAQVAKKRDVELRDVRVALLDPVDLKGFPVPDTKTKSMSWYAADFLPRKGEGILFLDELNSALPASQAACYQLMLNRRIGDYELPKGWTVVCAGNRDGDRGVTHRMPSPLANRLVHLDMDVSVDEWTTWAIDHDIEPHLIAFIRFRPHLLHDFKPAENPRAFPSPRSWSFVNDIYKSNLPANVELEMVKGTIGEGAASEFIAFVKLIGQLPNLDDLIMNPDKTEVPKEPAVLYALTTGLATRSSKDNFDRIMKFVEKIPTEFQVSFVRDSLRRKQDIANTKSFIAWSCKHEKVLIGG